MLFSSASDFVIYIVTHFPFVYVCPPFGVLSSLSTCLFTSLPQSCLSGVSLFSLHEYICSPICSPVPVFSHFLVPFPFIPLTGINRKQSFSALLYRTLLLLWRNSDQDFFRKLLSFSGFHLCHDLLRSCHSISIRLMFSLWTGPLQHLHSSLCVHFAVTSHTFG